MKKINIALSATIGDEGMLSVRDTYLDAVWHSGGIPTLLLPSSNEEYLKTVAESFDGFIFCGGEDIDPKYYGEEKSLHLGNICSKRDEFEKALFHAVYATGKPILGICRGMQAINVFLGGSLVQHIEGHVQNEQRSERTHNVHITSGSLLAEIVGCGEIAVNTFHHQVIKRPANALTVDAVSFADGYIEACHLEGHKFLLCVQWHPESYCSLDRTSKAIFDAFVRACKD